MNKIHVLLLCGGESSEHEVSLRSASFIAAQLQTLPNIDVFQIVINKQGQFCSLSGTPCQLDMKGVLTQDEQSTSIDFVIPCIHGYPGETGTIQAFLETINLPYLGCGPEASTLCFNKVSSKLWFDTLGINNTPWLFLTQPGEEEFAKAEAAFDQWGSIFIKAASQGSSVGCFKVEDKAELNSRLLEAFTYSDYVLIEKTIQARELEIATYEYNGEVIATLPSEIICPDDTFYTYEEKYAADSHSLTKVEAEGLTQAQTQQMQQWAIAAFKGLKLRHLSRIDFFLTAEGEILLNEINTFPGMTETSMFPQMLAHRGHDFAHFLQQHIEQAMTRIS